MFLAVTLSIGAYPLPSESFWRGSGDNLLDILVGTLAAQLFFGLGLVADIRVALGVIRPVFEISFVRNTINTREFILFASLISIAQ